MLGTVRIKVKPRDEHGSRSFDEVLQSSISTLADAGRLRSCTSHERLARALYHRRRYLKHLSDDDIHLRIGYLIANVAYVSERNRYSVNNLYSNYWRTKLAHAAEELAMRNCTGEISSDVLRHLPALGFATPQEPALEHGGKYNTVFRYDKLKYIRRLQSHGEIKLRCGSTEDAAVDFARNDSNELCIRLQLLREDVDMEFSSKTISILDDSETVKINLHQKTDFFMFCLSRVYDWRLFGDFSSGSDLNDPDNEMSCLVITDLEEFGKRFASAAVELLEARHSEFGQPATLIARDACYYDPCDPHECAPLFEEPLLLPFAKRHEFTYQREFRFVIRPDLPADFVPAYAPVDIPRFEREFIQLGSLEDISYIVPADAQPQDRRPHYLSHKDLNLFAAAMGVTLPSSGDKFRFTYSVEVKEKGRVDPQNLMNSQRFQGGSLQVHQQEIDIVTNRGACLLTALSDFYKVFDVREQGNHLIQYHARLLPEETSICDYRAYLACAEPPDAELEVLPVEFRFEYFFASGNGQVRSSIDAVAFEDGDTYVARINGVGPPQRYPTYRSLVLAEMEFIHRLIENRMERLVSYECVSRELGYRVSMFSVTRPTTSLTTSRCE
jgi:hypothetical protein